MFTKYGYFTIGIVLLIAFLLIALGIWLTDKPYLKYPLFVIAILISVFTLNFFRDPDRTTPKGDDLIVSPADGKVLFVKEVVDDEYLKGKALQVSIFMSPLNVHVNRIPISGKVEYLKYHEGEFFAAFEDKASSQNERFLTGINYGSGKVLFSQVAGYIARRIINELKQGDSVTVGERFGMIKFGSRVDVLVDPTSVPQVKAGDNVTAGETVLFKLVSGDKNDSE
ncbi:MAG: phosphatidylserine decarboxylase family protein [Ignavibacteriales bacterium]|nr:MAG: phosphatidylserine decarboxylase family protein [Ignavibacteriaceae bacterium]MBW7872919.1 phosphatidylserine decarboxylase family protein [Ignavibacteria bacterium]MCZ2142452.1 phosphatidylserine decarboxylase family protein [Ignavibacteriales bacterium]OQY72955.1 MAG: phosphatidylserine decarboxylase [Ignavibacteriales bacterium UTCHB3]MBV6445334.1 Phosphatidylserine decarboxylase proenzyme [Ignavibacteriaceae bacterium]